MKALTHESVPIFFFYDDWSTIRIALWCSKNIARINEVTGFDLYAVDEDFGVRGTTISIVGDNEFPDFEIIEITLEDNHS